MKRVVSISLGSSKRNKKVNACLFNTDFEIERVGTDGDMKKFQAMVAELDGKVDAFGVGGTDIYVYADKKRYTFNQILNLMTNAKKTPFVDGSGLKNTLERAVVAELQDSGQLDFSDKRVLMVCGVDRFGMSAALAERAKSIVFGDLMFGLGLPIAVRSWSQAKSLANLLLPVITKMPFDWLYPTGEKQNVNTPKFREILCRSRRDCGRFSLYRALYAAKSHGKNHSHEHNDRRKRRRTKKARRFPPDYHHARFRRTLVRNQRHGSGLSHLNGPSARRTDARRLFPKT